MSDAAISLVILGVVIVVFIWNRLPVGVVAIAAALSLYFTGLLDADAALAGFGDPVVIFIASLFVVSDGIEATGVTAWAGQAITRRAGTGRAGLLTVVMILCGVLTALVTPNGAVAAFLSMVVVLAVRASIPPSQMLLPMAFAAHAGSLLALTGSPVNVIVSDAARDAGADGYGYFEFAIVGVPLLAGTVLLSLWLGPYVLPRRTSREAAPDLGRHAQTLADHYGLTNGFYRLRVREGSPLIGQEPQNTDFTAYPGLTVIGVQHAGPARLNVDDVLVVAGPSEQVSRLVVDQVLAVSMRPVLDVADGTLLTRELGVVEVVVAPRSELVGETMFPGMKRGADLVILAVRRYGRDRGPRPTVLAEGDSILVHGTWPAIEALTEDRDVLVVDSPELVRRQAVPMGPRAGRAIAVLAGMIVLMASGLVPAAVAALLAATAMVVLRVLTPQQAYRSISWQTVVLIGGLIPLSTAIMATGAADLVAGVLIDAVGAGRPYLLLIALFGLTAALGQVVSNTATVLIVAPIAVSAAVETGVSPQPVLMLIAVAGAASFLTPIATPANMMVMGPGGYRFGDYWKLGLPVMALWLVVAVVVIPLVWPFAPG
ncbi:SLC13 family permease [Actinoplanes aureus]|uniref:SLC13 family permease n=1 Tax=Actinoplanes aureus TaxID=2792083 RepID=A0A931G336_9ACTN|nr:SLC13 family permease [Actinoplanes aureus]MBG0563894.1 SLC13 family permease [Actinoplanes aureus]